MKFMVLADVHQSEKHWQLLYEAVCDEKPDLVAIAGDLLPKYDGILAQLSFLPALKEYASAIRNKGAELVLILGNDDNHLAIPEMEKGDQQNLWHYVSDRVKKVSGWEICGCPWISDYPFAYKYWVAVESKDQSAISPLQLGPPATISSKNEIETIPDLEAYLKAKPSINQSLEKMAGQVKNISNSIWLIHGPPTKMDFDLCGSGDRVGSPAVYNFIAEKQPLLTTHGHIHEAPALNGGVWVKKLGRTVCIQAGQSFEELNYAIFNLNEGKIENLEHSIYGKYRDEL